MRGREGRVEGERRRSKDKRCGHVQGVVQAREKVCGEKERSVRWRIGAGVAMGGGRAGKNRGG